MSNDEPIDIPVVAVADDADENTDNVDPDLDIGVDLDADDMDRYDVVLIVAGVSLVIGYLFSGSTAVALLLTILVGAGLTALLEKDRIQTFYAEWS